MNAFGCRSCSWMSVPSSRLRSEVAFWAIARRPRSIRSPSPITLGSRSPKISSASISSAPISHQFRFSNIAGLPRSRARVRTPPVHGERCRRSTWRRRPASPRRSAGPVPRRNSTATVAPGAYLRTRAIRSVPSSSTCPSILVTTSPALQPGRGRRTGRLDRRAAARRWTVPRRRWTTSAPITVRRALPVSMMSSATRLRLVDRDGEGEADVAGLGVGGADRADHRVHADHPAGRVDQRAAGVALVDRGVGLDRRVVAGRAARLAGLDGPVQRADDAGR